MTEYKIITAREAINDLEEILSEYERIDKKIARRFFEQFQETRHSLETNPQRFQEVFLFVRRAFLTRFPFNVYFVVNESANEVEIIGVFHQKRDARLLRKRINFE